MSDYSVVSAGPDMCNLLWVTGIDGTPVHSCDVSLGPTYIIMDYGVGVALSSLACGWLECAHNPYSDIALAVDGRICELYCSVTEGGCVHGSGVRDTKGVVVVTSVVVCEIVGDSVSSPMLDEEVNDLCRACGPSVMDYGPCEVAAVELMSVCVCARYCGTALSGVAPCGAFGYVLELCVSDDSVAYCVTERGYCVPIPVCSWCYDCPGESEGSLPNSGCTDGGTKGNATVGCREAWTNPWLSFL